MSGGLRWLHGGAAGEGGFTLVELIVAMTLATIALGVASDMLIQTLQGGSKASASQRASQRAADAVEQFGNDLRPAQSPDRSSNVVSNVDGLRAYLLGADPFPGYDLRDVAQAGPNEIWFRSDVLPERANVPPVAECVGYHLDATGRLLRSVYADWRACPGTGTPTERIVLIDQPPANDRPVSMFRYTLLQTTGPTVIPIDPDLCRSSVTSTPVGRQVNNILMVTMDLRSYIVRGDTIGESSVRQSISIRSRLSHDYQYGLWCAY